MIFKRVQAAYFHGDNNFRAIPQISVDRACGAGLDCGLACSAR